MVLGWQEEELGGPPCRAFVVEPDAEGVQQGGPLGRREVTQPGEDGRGEALHHLRGGRRGNCER
ncbi:MAG TPA: hypothetical protein VGD71_01355 [Kribbella sp.]